MNYSIIRYIVGMTLILEGALMALSCIVAVIYGEPAFWALAVSVLGCVVLGLLLRGKRPAFVSLMRTGRRSRFIWFR